MTSVLDDPEYFGWMRYFLHDFYCRLKSNSGVIRFLMITGVTKLTKLSIFSGLNHLTDLSMNACFATLLGYTPEELDGPLRENIEVFAAKNGMDFAAAKRALLAWYDGYVSTLLRNEMSDWNEKLADAQDDPLVEALKG